MTAPNTTYSGVGLRDVQIFVLNTSGYPNATAADTAYSGVDIGGARSMTITTRNRNRSSIMAMTRCLPWTSCRPRSQSAAR